MAKRLANDRVLGRARVGHQPGNLAPLAIGVDSGLIVLKTKTGWR